MCGQLLHATTTTCTTMRINIDQCEQAHYEGHKPLFNISTCISENVELFHFANNHMYELMQTQLISINN